MPVTNVELYAEFLETLPEPALLVDAAGAVVFANARTYLLLDFARGELRGCPLEKLLSGPRWNAHHPAADDGTRPPAALGRRGERTARTAVRRDGRELPVEVSVAAHAFGSTALTVCVVRDMRAHQHLESLATLGAALRIAETRTDMIGILLAQILVLLDASGSSFVVRIPGADEILIEGACGLLADWSARRLPARDTIGNRVIAERQSYVSNDPAEHATLVARGMPAEVHGLAMVPVQAEQQVFGALCVVKETPVAEHEVRLLGAIGDMAALALQRQTLHERLVADAAALEDAYETMIAGWARAIDRRERMAEGHTQRVTDMTVRLARLLGLPEEQIPDIRRGALLHDVGKMIVPDAILQKPGALDEAERAVMRKHTEYAYDLLGSSDFLRAALDIPYFHHERWDGAGYPRGLAGESIPLAARIFAVADVYDAIRSDRAYQTARPHEAALQYVVDASGRHFDPKVVDALRVLTPATV